MTKLVNRSTSSIVPASDDVDHNLPLEAVLKAAAEATPCLQTSEFQGDKMTMMRRGIDVNRNLTTLMLRIGDLTEVARSRKRSAPRKWSNSSIKRLAFRGTLVWTSLWYSTGAAVNHFTLIVTGAGRMFGPVRERKGLPHTSKEESRA